MVEIDMHVGQHRPLGCRACDPLERQRQMRMRRVRPPPERIDDKPVEPRKMALPDRFRNRQDVGNVGEPANAKTERLDVAVVDIEGIEGDRAARAGDRDRPLDRVQIADRRIYRELVGALGLRQRG